MIRSRLQFTPALHSDKDLEGHLYLFPEAWEFLKAFSFAVLKQSPQHLEDPPRIQRLHLFPELYVCKAYLVPTVVGNEDRILIEVLVDSRIVALGIHFLPANKQPGISFTPLNLRYPVESPYSTSRYKPSKPLRL